MAYLTFLFVRGFIDLFRWVPFGVLYRLSDGLAFLLEKVVKYRKKVVMDNIERCFPEINAAEKARMVRLSYRNLADIVMESLKGATVPLDDLLLRYRYINPELVNDVLASGRSVILTAAHYNNWEWGVLTIAQRMIGPTIGVYKPMSNHWLDQWFKQNRARGGKMILKSVKETFRAVEEYKNTPSMFILVADQAPSNRKTAIPAWFFKQPTACLPGVETIACTHNHAVIMLDIQRVSRGNYELSFSEVCMEPTQTAPGEVTQMLMNRFEAIIRKAPENWLWSHKRWKWTPDMSRQNTSS